MKRLLIVDDEHNIVNWLAELFSTQADMDLEIMRAYSGFEMLELLKSYRMDVILLDIQMPGMTGLEAARKGLAQWPATHIVFLTAYENFDYVYQANHLGNTSYLLKTENDETIINAVRKVLEQIAEEEKNRDIIAHANTTRLLLEHLMQQDFLRMLVHGSYSHPSARDKTSGMIPIDFSRGFYLIYTQLSGSPYHRAAKTYKDGPAAVCLSFVNTLLYDTFHFCMLELEQGAMLWFFQDYRQSEIQQDIPAANFLRNISEDLAAIAEKPLHCHLINLLLEEPVSCQNICPVFHQLQQYGLSHLLQNDCRVSSSSTVSINTLASFAPSSDTADSGPVNSKSADELSFYLYQKNEPAYMALMNEISQKCARITSMHDLSAIQLYSAIALLLLQYISQHGLEEKIALKIGVYPLYYVHDFPDWKTAFQYLISLSGHLFSLISDAESNRNEHLISIVERYIAENLSKPLSLSDVAACINYNATYVSRLYRQLRGISLTEYITQCRIKKAKKLLLNTTESIQNIARETGFDTSQYFSIVFKKETGVSPREYRNSHLTI
ncbi:response regulator transcription factor [Eisenbergiella sp.]